MTEQTRLSVDIAVVGGGLSGLRAARALADAGREVVVLEARDRVGGRLYNATLGDGVTVDLGGQWVGSDHVRVQRLAGELGVELFPQHGDGRNLLDVAGRWRRYRGTIPRLGPRVLWDVFVARRRIDRMARAVGAEAPWAAERAAELDRQTLAEWCERNVRTEVARELIGLAGRTSRNRGPDRARSAAGWASPARGATAPRRADQVRGAVRGALLAGQRTQRRVGHGCRPCHAHLRQLAAGRLGRCPAWLRRRPRGARARGDAGS